MPIDPKTAKQHADKFDELRKTSPTRAAVYLARHEVAIMQHQLTDPPDDPPRPGRPKTPHHDEAERLTRVHSKIAGAAYRMAHPFQMREEAMALHAWEHAPEPQTDAIGDAVAAANPTTTTGV